MLEPSLLLIDDVRLYADVAASALRRAGYDVLTAADGAAGLALLRTRRPALVLLDIAMPVMSGIDVLRAVRADPDPAVAATPVMIVSATSNEPRTAEAVRLGVQGYLLKSRFSLAQLVEAVRALVPLTPRADPTG